MNPHEAPGPTAGAIRTVPKPRCYLCGGPGGALYSGMRDRLFGAPGEWSLRRCDDPACGLVWLDPCPEVEDIPKLYRTYYTHRHENGPVLAAYRWLSRGASPPTPGRPGPGWWARRVGGFLARAGVFRDAFQSSALWLPPGPGRLLDVGCGNGDFLARMHASSYEVEGLEPDPVASAVARGRGFRVTTGPLAPGTFPANSFDVVTLSHVLEHLPDPVATLRVCRAVLRPGGRVVVVTPNARSLGVRTFGPHWRGWEVPRHLLIFTPTALAEAARHAGFAVVTVRTSGRMGWMLWRYSDRLRAQGQLPAGRLPVSINQLPGAFAFHLREHSALAHRPVGEELVLTARFEAR